MSVLAELTGLQKNFHADLEQSQQISFQQKFIARLT